MGQSNDALLTNLNIDDLWLMMNRGQVAASYYDSSPVIVTRVRRLDYA